MTIDLAIREAFVGVSTATITTVLQKKGLRKVWMRGTTSMLRFVPTREDLVTPDAMGVTDAGIFGDILCARMVKKDVAGLVTDGVLHDLTGVLGTGLRT